MEDTMDKSTFLHVRTNATHAYTRDPNFGPKCVIAATPVSKSAEEKNDVLLFGPFALTPKHNLTVAVRPATRKELADFLLSEIVQRRKTDPNTTEYKSLYLKPYFKVVKRKGRSTNVINYYKMQLRTLPTTLPNDERVVESLLKPYQPFGLRDIYKIKYLVHDHDDNEKRSWNLTHQRLKTFCRHSGEAMKLLKEMFERRPPKDLAELHRNVCDFVEKAKYNFHKQSYACFKYPHKQLVLEVIKRLTECKDRRKIMLFFPPEMAGRLLPCLHHENTGCLLCEKMWGYLRLASQKGLLDFAIYSGSPLVGPAGLYDQWHERLLTFWKMLKGEKGTIPNEAVIERSGFLWLKKALQGSCLEKTKDRMKLYGGLWRRRCQSGSYCLEHKDDVPSEMLVSTGDLVNQEESLAYWLKKGIKGFNKAFETDCLRSLKKNELAPVLALKSPLTTVTGATYMFRGDYQLLVRFVVQLLNRACIDTNGVIPDGMPVLFPNATTRNDFKYTFPDARLGTEATKLQASCERICFAFTETWTIENILKVLETINQKCDIYFHFSVKKLLHKKMKYWLVNWRDEIEGFEGIFSPSPSLLDGIETVHMSPLIPKQKTVTTKSWWKEVRAENTTTVAILCSGAAALAKIDEARGKRDRAPLEKGSLVIVRTQENTHRLAGVQQRQQTAKELTDVTIATLGHLAPFPCHFTTVFLVGPGWTESHVKAAKRLVSNDGNIVEVRASGDDCPSCFTYEAAKAKPKNPLALGEAGIQYAYLQTKALMRAEAEAAEKVREESAETARLERLRKAVRDRQTIQEAQTGPKKRARILAKRIV